MATVSVAPSWNFPILFIFCVYFLFVFTNQVYSAPANDLYTDKDDVLLLNQSNFADTVFNKDRAFVIEFYNRYCGHCQRYAKTWVDFAKDIKHWNTVAAVGALDCSVSANVQICQDYEIPAFPTVKHFWTYVTQNDHGVSVPHKDVDFVRHNLLDFLTQNAETKGTPNHWPMLLPVTGATLAGIWKNLPSEITSFFLVVEKDSSYIGREVVLDFSATDARVLRVEDTSATQIDNLPEIESYPALVLLTRTGDPQVLLRASEIEARAKFRKIIEDATGIKLDKDDDNDNGDNGNDNNNNGDKTNQTMPVQMVDLENTLHNLLVNEVALKKELTGEKLTAFKSFLAALTKSFPGRPQVMKFLQNLYKWVNDRSAISSDDLQRSIQDSQVDGAFLPDMIDWVGCKGSIPRYRGYPCGLWTMFHSMTVQAYNNYLEGEIPNPQQVLYAIHNYVYHFFGCTECAEHFHSMAVNLDAEVQHPNDTVLWLWHAHNKVNLRLKGDFTEDPTHPKIQFPPLALCKQCRKNSDPGYVHWDFPMVLRFMTSYYGRGQISQEGVVPVKDNLSRRRRGETNKLPSFGWNFRYFSGLDISLCVLLYVFSMVLLFVVFLLFRFRRHKLKRKNCFSLRHVS